MPGMPNISPKMAATIAAAMACCLPFIHTHEGESLESYEDVVGVWTICHGVTKGIKPGMVKTEAECDALTENTLGQFMSNVAASLEIEPNPELLAAHTSFAYNIGIGGYKSSNTLKQTNKGNFAAGCRAMANWYTASGKDCRIKVNNCYGVIKRRDDEIALCLKGAASL